MMVAGRQVTALDAAPNSTALRSTSLTEAPGASGLGGDCIACPALDDDMTEAGMIGREGFIGVPVLLDADT
jgi:hypothetical protein